MDLGLHNIDVSNNPVPQQAFLASAKPVQTLLQLSVPCLQIELLVSINTKEMMMYRCQQV